MEERTLTLESEELFLACLASMPVRERLFTKRPRCGYTFRVCVVTGRLFTRDEVLVLCFASFAVRDELFTKRPF